MAKIPRSVITKLFGEDLINTRKAVLGSKNTTSNFINTDPFNNLQDSLQYFGGGFDNSALGLGNGTKAPYTQEMNGLIETLVAIVKQLQQQGISEYSPLEDYYIGYLAKEIGGSKLYVSKTDTNVGNALTDNSNWLELDLNKLQNASPTQIGVVQMATGATTNIVYDSLQVDSFTGNLRTQDIINTNRTLVQDDAGRLLSIISPTTDITLPLINTITSGSLFYLKNETTNIVNVNIAGHTGDGIFNLIPKEERIIQSNGGTEYKIISQKAKIFASGYMPFGNLLIDQVNFNVKIPHTFIESDNINAFSIVNNNYTVKIAGYYRIQGSCRVYNLGAGITGALYQIRLNGTVVFGSYEDFLNGEQVTAQAMQILYLNVNDVIDFTIRAGIANCYIYGGYDGTLFTIEKVD